VVHNLRTVNFAEGAAPFDWATRFDALVRGRIRDGDRESLIDYPFLGEDAQRSIPTPEHYLPLLYVLGAAYDDEPASFFNDEIDLASVSMTGAMFDGTHE
jgi:4,5-DOPA dioxygenase extradiol